jgi:hypothetical protein
MFVKWLRDLLPQSGELNAAPVEPARRRVSAV